MNPSTERESGDGNAKLKISRLPFADVPGQSRLFLEYLRDPRSLKKYYPNAPGSIGDVIGFVPEVLANYTIDRRLICDALNGINEAIGQGPKTRQNIERLRDRNTVAILTGQQAGLFSGPLYTIYKALSAIKMAERLTATGIAAVPIFWTATEDHDFEEVSSAFFIDSSGGLIRSSHNPEGRVADSPVGAVKLDDSITAEIDKLFASLQGTEFSAATRDLIENAWQPGDGFGKAFLKTLAGLLEKFGLIFADPMDARLKRLAQPIFAKAVRETEQVAVEISRRSDELRARGFEPQVLVEPDYCPLFWIDDDGRRLALRRSGNRTYTTKTGGREFKLDELEQFILDDSTKFSPGVMLRPVVQDYLFPTVCYFGGGAEIAYFAQNSVVYEYLGRPVTPILHRQSFTVIEARQRRMLDKLGIDLADLFETSDALTLRLAAETLTPETASLFADVEKGINVELDRLELAIAKIDVTVAANVATRRRKINYHLAALRKKSLLAYTRNDETLRLGIDRLYSALMPKGGLQERSINIFSYLNRFGPNFIDWIYDAIDLEDKEHRIVEI